MIYRTSNVPISSGVRSVSLRSPFIYRAIVVGPSVFHLYSPIICDADIGPSAYRGRGGVVRGTRRIHNAVDARCRVKLQFTARTMDVRVRSRRPRSVNGPFVRRISNATVVMPGQRSWRGAGRPRKSFYSACFERGVKNESTFWAKRVWFARKVERYDWNGRVIDIRPPSVVRAADTPHGGRVATNRR